MTEHAIGTLDEFSDRELSGAFDRVTLARGADYARAGRVTSIVVGDEGTRAAARVIGTGPGLYRTEVTLTPDPHGEQFLDTDCTCPVGFACKHAAALVIALRTQRPWRTDQPSGSERGTSWRDALGDLLDVPEPEPRTGVVGLLLDVEEPSRRPTTWEPQSRTRRIQLRPMIPGAVPGRWIKTGISWEAVSGGYYSSYAFRLDGPPLDALTAIADAHRRGSRMSGYGRAPASIPLDLMGRGWIDLLIRARDAGVVLLTSATNSGEVRLVPDEGHFALDLSPTGDGGVRAVPTLDLPEGAGEVVVVGEPPTGWFRQEERDLSVGGFGPDVDQAAARVVSRGPFTIPPEDWSSFAIDKLPVLQRRARVRTHEGLSLPEVVPPRLHLAVRFDKDHTARVTWSFRYGPRDAPVTVPLHREPMTYRDPDAFRDPAVEAQLLTALPTRDELPALWDLTRAGWMPRESVELTGFDTVAFAELLPEIEAHDDVEVDVVGERTAYAEVTAAPQIAVGTAQSSEGNDWFDLGISVTVAARTSRLRRLIEALARGDERMHPRQRHLVLPRPPRARELRALVDEARALQDKPSDPLRLSVVHAGLWEELAALGVVEQQSDRCGRARSARCSTSTPSARRAGRAARGRSTPRCVPTRSTGSAGCRCSGTRARRRARRRHGAGQDAADARDGAAGARARRAGRAGARRGAHVGAGHVGERGRAVRARPAHRASSTAPGARPRSRMDETIAGRRSSSRSYAVARIDDGGVPVACAGLRPCSTRRSSSRTTRPRPTRRCAGSPARVKFAHHRHAARELAHGPVVAAVDRRARAAPAAGAVQGAVGQADRERRRSPSGSPRCAAASARSCCGAPRRPWPPTCRPSRSRCSRSTLHPRHRAIYDRHLPRERQRLLGLIDDLDGNRIAILRALTVLRQMSLDPSLVDEAYGGVAPSAKVDALVEQLAELAEEGHRALVFSQFTGFLAIVRARLEAEGIAYAYLDGSTRNRAERRARRSARGTAPVFLISLKAGGFGLTLTEADYVFVLDPWWNPAAEAQAIDRAHRIGQTRPVNVYRLVSRDTIEEKVVALQERKRDLFARVVDEGNLLSSALTADDLRGLLDR